MDNKNIRIEERDDSVLIKHTIETGLSVMDRVFRDPVVEVCNSSDRKIGIYNYVEYEDNKWMLKLNYDPSKKETFRLGLMLSGIDGDEMLDISEYDEEIEDMTEDEIIDRAYELETSFTLVDSKEELRRMVLSDDPS